MKPRINIVWFKRDLRLQDHVPLKKAIEDNLPILLIYIFEPSLINATYSDSRHWRFVVESIRDLNIKLISYGQKIQILYGEVMNVFREILRYYEVIKLFSYQETGTWLTYQRDLNLKKFLSKNGVVWEEFQNNSVIRGLKNRENWVQKREEYLSQSTQNPQIDKLIKFDLSPEILKIFSTDPFISQFDEYYHQMQKGGESEAHKVLNSFLSDRHKGYVENISRPEYSRRHCSRLSPYIAWGNISVRQIEQAKNKFLDKNDTSRRDLLAFQSRLAWHCHFVQKLESEPSYEFKNINSAYDVIRKDKNEIYFNAWKNGMTGYPLIDASIRCVRKTGYINFRMRAMLVSFLTHHLWLDWKDGAHFLARQFLDFEPGIHFTQFQMQAGTTGINTIRIYNPIKQALDNDPRAIFIKKWVPELRKLPFYLALEPWKISPIEEIQYNFRYGVDYPKRIVDISQTYKKANSILWEIKKSNASRKEALKILAKHVKIK